MNPSFVLVLNIYISIIYYRRYKQNGQLSFLVKRDTKIANLKAKAHEKRFLFSKFKSQIILMRKNGLNVEHFHYHITINYDKCSSACIN